MRVRTSATNVFHKNAIRRTSILSFEITMRFKLNPETEIVNLNECLKRKALLSNHNLSRNALFYKFRNLSSGFNPDCIIF